MQSNSLGYYRGRGLSDHNEQTVVGVDPRLKLQLVQLEVDQSPELLILVAVGDHDPHSVLHGLLDNAVKDKCCSYKMLKMQCLMSTFCMSLSSLYGLHG